MSSFKPLAALRIVAVGVALATTTVLAACSGLQPVYGERGIASKRLELAYNEPGTRLDQIVIQDLQVRLGKSASPDAPLVTISAYPGNRVLARSQVGRPNRLQEATVTVSYAVQRDGEVLISGIRSATATYTVNSQVLADESAYEDALERAAKSAADIVRLTILAQLAVPPARS